MNRFRSRVVFAAGGFLAAGAVTVALLSDGTGAGGDVPPSFAGCHEVETQELYVQHTFACDDGSRLLVFTDGRARDDYLKVAEYFGTVTLDRGEHWARIR